MPPTSNWNSADTILKGLLAALMAVCAVVGSMLGWYVVRLTERVDAASAAYTAESEKNREALSGTQDELWRLRYSVEAQAERDRTP